MKKLLALLVLLISSTVGYAQSTVLHFDSVPAVDVRIDKGWKYLEGDDMQRAQPFFNDEDWENFTPTATDIADFIKTHSTAIGWFRLKFRVADSLRMNSWVLYYASMGASEVYFNGKLLLAQGIISNNAYKVKAVNHINISPIALTLSPDSIQVLAIRFAYQKGIPYLNQLWGTDMMSIRISTLKAVNNWRAQTYKTNLFYVCFFFFGVFLILSILHAIFFMYYRKARQNLYYSIFAFSLSIGWLSQYVFIWQTTVMIRMWSILTMEFVNHFAYAFYLLTIYALVRHTDRKIFKGLLLLSVATVPLVFFSLSPGIRLFNMFFPLVFMIEAFRIAWKARQNNVMSSKILVFGTLAYFVFAVPGLISFVLKQYEIGALSFSLGSVSTTVMMSMAIGLQLAFTNRVLHQKLNEIEELSKEKEDILQSQNQRLENQVVHRTSELKQSLEDLKATQTQLIQSEKMASLGELTAGIAHEIQNPLNFVNNFAEVNTELVDELHQEAANGNLDEVRSIANDLKDNNHKIAFHGRRAESIVKAMLQHSRTGSGKKELTDINALTDEFLRLSYHGLRAKDKSFNATMETHFDYSIEKIGIFPQDFGRVLLNLFNNAFYSVNEKKKALDGLYEPKVMVSTEKLGDKVQIMVTDNGNGISQKILDKIYQPFFTTKPTGDGTGLGLSLSYDIITKGHGGEIKLETKEGEFALFKIIIPAFA